MANPLTVIGPAELIPAQQSETFALIHMIERVARDPGVDIDKLERLMEMQQRMIERNARSAYAAALSAMQPELPAIIERGKIDIGRGKPQSYALWEDINDAIKPVLARHGFALSFRTGQEEGKVVITGILSHKDGHSEQTIMHLPVDTSGSKNAVQAVGSSTSYGKRYTAGALLNLTSRGEDNDGNDASVPEAAKAAAPPAPGAITQDQADAIIELLESREVSRTAFLQWAKQKRIVDIPAEHFDSCIAAISKFKPKA
jgi:hypothetical protein